MEEPLFFLSRFLIVEGAGCCCLWSCGFWRQNRLGKDLQNAVTPDEEHREAGHSWISSVVDFSTSRFAAVRVKY